jgi:hypothetical protein
MGGTKVTYQIQWRAASDAEWTPFHEHYQTEGGIGAARNNLTDAVNVWPIHDCRENNDIVHAVVKARCKTLKPGEILTVRGDDHRIIEL